MLKNLPSLDICNMQTILIKVKICTRMANGPQSLIQRYAEDRSEVLNFIMVIKGQCSLIYIRVL